MSAIIVWGEYSAWSDYANLMADANFAGSSNYHLGDGGGIDPVTAGSSPTIGTVFCDYGCDPQFLAVTEEHACDPTVDGCLLPLTPKDSVFIANMDQYFVDTDQMMNPDRKRACKLMEAKFRDLRANNRIFRGNSLMGDGPILHDGETFPAHTRKGAGIREKTLSRTPHGPSIGQTLKTLLPAIRA